MRARVFKSLSLVLVLSLSFSPVHAEQAALQPAMTAAASEASPAAVPSGRIVHMQGGIELKAPGDTEWKTAGKGAWVSPGAEVKTAEGARCEIALAKSLVHLKGASQASLDEFGPDKTRVGLKAGSLFVLVRELPKNATFEVSSPAAVASARGTGWAQDMGSIQVFEHTVVVESPNGESMLVEEGKGLQFEEGDGGLGQVFEVPSDAKEEWNEFESKAEERLGSEDAKEEDKKEETAASGDARLPMPSDPALEKKDPSAADATSTMRTTADYMPKDGEERTGVQPPDDPMDRPEMPAMNADGMDSTMEKLAESDVPDTMMKTDDGMLEPEKMESDRMMDGDMLETSAFEGPDMMKDDSTMEPSMMEQPDMFESFERFDTMDSTGSMTDAMKDATETMSEIREEQREATETFETKLCLSSTTGQMEPC